MQSIFSQFIALGLALIPFLLTLVFIVFALMLMHRLLLGNKKLSMSEKFPRQLILMLMYTVSIVTLVIALPLESSSRNQVLGLIGILLSGVIAFSSTTIVSNIMAGIVMRITQPFRTGDFVRVGNYFGRVTERGMFDTELQTEQRELIAFSNSYLLNQPIQVVRSSGTIISASLSLGYDLHHDRIEALLIRAAENVGLSEPFVQIMELGDFSISYRVSGLLSEVKSMISARSKLMASVLDTLHEDKIEIVSPNFVNQRRMDDMPPVIAHAKASAGQKNSADQPQAESQPEALIFDKAEEAESKEKQILTIKEKIAANTLKLKDRDTEEKEKLKAKILKLENTLEALLQEEHSKS